MLCKDGLKLADRERPMSESYSVGAGTIIGDWSYEGGWVEGKVSWVGRSGSTAVIGSEVIGFSLDPSHNFQTKGGSE